MIEPEYVFTFDDGSQTVAHMGVKGMKWGVWNAETRARRTGDTSKKARMFEKGMAEVEKQHDISSKYHEKSAKLRYKAEHGSWGRSKSRKLAKYSKKAARYMRKAHKGNNAVKALKYQAKVNTMQAKIAKGSSKAAKAEMKAVKADVKIRKMSKVLNKHYDTPMGQVTDRQVAIGRNYLIAAFD